MMIDYDLFVIDSENKDTTESQLRDCLHHAIKELDERLKHLEEVEENNNAYFKFKAAKSDDLERRLEKQEKLMEVMVSHLDTQSKINRGLYDDISLCKECWCMTRTEDNKCKKCGKDKNAQINTWSADGTIRFCTRLGDVLVQLNILGHNILDNVYGEKLMAKIDDFESIMTLIDKISGKAEELGWEELSQEMVDLYEEFEKEDNFSRLFFWCHQYLIRLWLRVRFLKNKREFNYVAKHMMSDKYYVHDYKYSVFSFAKDHPETVDKISNDTIIFYADKLSDKAKESFDKKIDKSK